MCTFLVYAQCCTHHFSQQSDVGVIQNLSEILTPHKRNYLSKTRGCTTLAMYALTTIDAIQWLWMCLVKRMNRAWFAFSCAVFSRFFFLLGPSAFCCASALGAVSPAVVVPLFAVLEQSVCGTAVGACITGAGGDPNCCCVEGLRRFSIWENWKLKIVPFSHSTWWPRCVWCLCLFQLYLCWGCCWLCRQSPLGLDRLQEMWAGVLEGWWQWAQGSLMEQGRPRLVE